MIETKGSHSSSTTGLAKRELNAPKKNLRVDVKGLTFDDRGARMRVKVWSDGFFSCPKHLLVVHSSGGEVLGHRYVQTEGYSFLGLKSGIVPCTAEASVRLTGASRTTGVQFALYSGDTSVDAVREGTVDSLAGSQTYFLDDLADVARRDRSDEQEGSIVGGSVESTVQSAVQPVIKWGGGLVALYMLVDNREIISDLFRDLVTTESDS